MNLSLAPIVLFVYNRPWHTIITINSLKKNYLSANSNLYIYSDHPKNASENNKVEKVKKFTNVILYGAKPTIVIAPSKKGAKKITNNLLFSKKVKLNLLLLIN